MFKRENYLFALLALTFSFNADLFAQDDSADDVEEVIINQSVVKSNSEPLIIHSKNKKTSAA